MRGFFSLSLIRFWRRPTWTGRAPSTSRSSATSWASRRTLPTTSGSGFDVRKWRNSVAQPAVVSLTKIFIGWTRLDILTALKVSLYLFEWLNHAPCSLSLSTWTRTRCSFFFSVIWHPHSRNTFKYCVLRSLHCSISILHVSVLQNSCSLLFFFSLSNLY